MKKIHFKKVILAGAALMMVSPLPASENNPDQQELLQHLEHTRQLLVNAQQQADAIVRNARQQANTIREMAVIESDELGPLAFQNQKISVEVSAGKLKDILATILPPHWRVLVDSQDIKLQERRFQFVSTRTREQSLNDLLKPIGLKHQYFFDLKDEQGKPSPLLIVSKR